jgi:hypothetical protein
MRKPHISVIVPTIEGRESSLERCLEAYHEQSFGARLDMIVIEDAPTCGVAWQEGAAEAAGDYLHFSADDLEPHLGWWEPAVEACDQKKIPCPVVFNPDATVQSAGGDLDAPNCLLTAIGEDWTAVPFTTVPFLTRNQWDRIGMIDLHYFTDVWVSYTGRRLGIPTVLRTGYTVTHHNEPAGRGAGMTQGERAHYDRDRFAELLAATG